MFRGSCWGQWPWALLPLGCRLKRKLSFPVSRMWQRWVRRSSGAVIIGAGFIMRDISTKTKLVPSSTVSKQSSSKAGNCSSIRPGNCRAVFIVESDRRCLVKLANSSEGRPFPAYNLEHALDDEPDDECRKKWVSPQAHKSPRHRHPWLLKNSAAEPGQVQNFRMQDD